MVMKNSSGIPERALSGGAVIEGAVEILNGHEELTMSVWRAAPSVTAPSITSGLSPTQIDPL
jgi:hypothetical protein